MADDKKISQLPSADTNLSHDDTGLVVQGGVTKKTKLSSQKDLFNSEILDVKMNAFGFTADVKKSKRFKETTTPNTLQDITKDPVRFTGGLRTRDVENIVLPDAPFSGSTDELLNNTFTTGSAHKAGDIVFSGNGVTETKTQVGENTTNLIVADSTKYAVGVNVLIKKVSDGSKTVKTVVALADSTNLTLDSVFSRLAEDYEISVVEQTYQAKATTASGDLVTDTNKFTKIDRPTRQDVVLIMADGKYGTFKGYKTFDRSVSNSKIATDYGWSKTGVGEYKVTALELVTANGTKTYTGNVFVVGLVQRLNAKMYDKVFNSMGTMKDSDDKFDHQVTNTSTYQTLSKAVNSTSGRSDGRVATKFYFDDLGGMIFLPQYAISKSEHDIAEDAINGLVNGSDLELAIDCGVEIFSKTKFSHKHFHAGNGFVYGNVDFLLSSTDESLTELGCGIVIGNSGKPYICDELGYINATRTVVNIISKYGDIRSDLTNGVSDIYLMKGSTVITQGTQTYMDIIGDPAQYTIADTVDGDKSQATSGTTGDADKLVYNTDEKQMYKSKDDVDYANAVDGNADYNKVYKGYPTAWLDRLKSGLSLDFNANLVDVNSGDGLVNNYNEMTFSRKSNTHFHNINTEYNRHNEKTAGPDEFSTTLNKFSYSGWVVANIALVTAIYKAQNRPLTSATAKQIVKAPTKAFATNSHSVYQGAMVANSNTGKIGVSSLAGSLEGVVVENVEVINAKFSTMEPTMHIFYDDIVFMSEKGTQIRNSLTPKDGLYMRYIGAERILITADWDFSVGSYFEVYKNTTPKHNTINLNKATSPASKFLPYLTVADDKEYVLQVQSEEMIWDFGKDNDNVLVYKAGDGDVTSLPHQPFQLMGFENSTLNGRIFTQPSGATSLGSWNADAFNAQYLAPDGYIRNRSNNTDIGLKLWAGNGLGDNDKFSKATNSSVKDLNGNNVTTTLTERRLGYYKKD